MASTTLFESVLGQSSWIRRRARRLARDSHAADDLAQETFLTALTHELPARESLRAWLAALMKNVLRQDVRAASRRRVREAAVARPEAESRDRDVRAVRELLNQVLNDLEEPFRTTLVLRYYEGLGPQEIARRTGAPIDTVRSRLRRGLVRMRRRVTSRLRRDDRRFMAALFAPLESLAKLAPSVSTGVMGMIVMKVSWKIAACAALILAGAWIVPELFAPDAPPRDTPTSFAGDSAALEGLRPPVPPAVDEASPVEAARTVLGEPEPAVDPIEALRTGSLRIGWVLDSGATPVAGVSLDFVALGGRRTSLESGAQGRVELELGTDTGGKIVCVDDRYATILDGVVEPGSDIEPVLVVAPAADMAGVVVDAAGRPIADARVELRMPDGFQRAFVRVLDASRERVFVARSDGGGFFSLPRMPAVAGALLVTHKAGFLEDEREAPLVDDARLHIILETREVDAGALLGRVVDPDGLPVAGARVAAAGSVLRTDSLGEFVFPPEIRAKAHELVAVQPGHQPARYAATETATGPSWPDYVELHLGGPPLEIRGRVVDEEAVGLPGMRVWIADPSHFGVEEDMPVQVEGLTVGVASTGELELQGASLEKTPSSFWSWVVTGPDGRFRLGGLLPRTYRVKAMQTELMLHAEVEEVRAGTHDVEILLPVLRGGRTIAGRVLSTGSMPIVGAGVSAYHRAFGVEYGEWSTTVWDFEGPHTTTDEEGRFEFLGLPERGVWLYASGAGIVGRRHVIEAGDALDEVEIRVEVDETGVAHFRIELEDPGRADRFALLDPEGEPFAFAYVRAGYRVTVAEASLVDGGSYVYAVREGRYQVVLYRGETEVERLRVTLTPGDVTTIRP